MGDSNKRPLNGLNTCTDPTTWELLPITAYVAPLMVCDCSSLMVAISFDGSNVAMLDGVGVDVGDTVGVGVSVGVELAPLLPPPLPPLPPPPLPPDMGDNDEAFELTDGVGVGVLLGMLDVVVISIDTCAVAHMQTFPLLLIEYYTIPEIR